MRPPGISNTADSHHTNQHCAPGRHREAQLFQGRLACLSRMNYRIDLGVGALVHAVADDLKSRSSIKCRQVCLLNPYSLDTSISAT